VGHRAPSLEAGYLAAVKACGEGSAIGAAAAAYLLGLVGRAPPEPVVLTPRQRRVRGVVTRHCRRLDRRDVTVWRGVPVTNAPRTLVDLAAELGAPELAHACHEAWVRFRTRPEQVEAVLARRPNSPGSRALRAVLRGDVPVSLSELEARFLALLRARGLPLPETNRRAGSKYVDCRWPERRLTVELDSYRYHGSRHAWEQDRRREREAYARGDQFRRYTYGDVFERPGPMLTELAAALAP